MALGPGEADIKAYRREQISKNSADLCQVSRTVEHTSDEAIKTYASRALKTPCIYVYFVRVRNYDMADVIFW